MKYSSTDRPSRKFDLIGRGMVSPLGLATRPRMPAICRSWFMLPRAPELTIWAIGLVGGKLSFMADMTSSVVLVQISMSSLLNSSRSSVPRSRLFCLVFSSASASRSSSPLDAGVTTSAIEMVAPERVAQWKPRSFSASSTAATSTLL